MANFLTKLLGGGNNQIASGGGGGGALVSNADISGINPENLLSGYNKSLDPNNIQKLPDYVIPKIEKPELATERQAADAEAAEKVFKEGVKNGKKVLKAAGKMEGHAAELVAAFGEYVQDQRDADLVKIKANADNAKHAASHGLGIQKEAASLKNVIQQKKYEISQVAASYQKIGGW